MKLSLSKCRKFFNQSPQMVSIQPRSNAPRTLNGSKSSGLLHPLKSLPNLSMLKVWDTKLDLYFIEQCLSHFECMIIYLGRTLFFGLQSCFISSLTYFPILFQESLYTLLLGCANAPSNNPFS